MEIATKPNKMKQNLIIVSLIVASIISCSTEEPIDYPKEDLINSYYINYMNYSDNFIVSPSFIPIVNLEYNSQNQITKRIGGFLEINPASGYYKMFSDEILDELSYSTNKIIIEKKTSSTQYQIPIFKRVITLNNNGKIIQEITETENNKKTVDYQYNTAGRLFCSKFENEYSTNETVYYYNVQKNIDSIVAKSYSDQLYTGKTVEIFKDYDDVSNPLKHLFFFEEIFNRSLSLNNYASYEKLLFDKNNTLQSAYETKWTFTYDEKGSIRFDKTP